MKRLSLIVVAFAVAVGGIAVAQQPRKVEASNHMIPTCMKLGSASSPDRVSMRGYTVDMTTRHEGKTYRCAAIFDQWMIKTSRVAWVQVP